MPSGDNGLGVGGPATIVFLLLNEVRHGIIRRLFGVSRRDSNLLSVFAVGGLLGTLAAAAARIRGMRVRPSLTDTGIGVAVLKETTHGIAGAWSRTTPFFSALVVLVVLEKSFGPTVRGVLRGFRGSIRGFVASARRVRAVVAGQ